MSYLIYNYATGTFSDKNIYIVKFLILFIYCNTSRKYKCKYVMEYNIALNELYLVLVTMTINK